jgi:hypothetical protein
MIYLQTKNTNLGKFCWVLQWEDVGIFYGNSVYFWLFGMFSGYFVFLWSFGMYIFPVLVCYAKKNLATLIPRQQLSETGHFFCSTPPC